jgi:serine/threonine-protein kinase RIO1
MEVDGSKESRKVRLKDWVLLTERFQERARRVIIDTIIDHIPRQVDRELVNRREIDRSRGPGEIEKEIDVTDKEEGITNAHVLMVVLNRVEGVQRKVQLEYCKERRAALDRVKSDLKVLTERLVESSCQRRAAAGAAQ